MSRETILPLVAQVEALEKLYPQGFARFSDLSGLSEVTLSADTIREIARMRVEAYSGPEVKSAIFSPDPLAYGIMRIYAALMHPSPINVQTFYKTAEAAAWLTVPDDALAVNNT